jgi:uncharacterized coiled-coil protein SlyX
MFQQLLALTLLMWLCLVIEDGDSFTFRTIGTSSYSWNGRSSLNFQRKTNQLNSKISMELFAKQEKEAEAYIVDDDDEYGKELVEQIKQSERILRKKYSHNKPPRDPYGDDDSSNNDYDEEDLIDDDDEEENNDSKGGRKKHIDIIGMYDQIYAEKYRPKTEEEEDAAYMEDYNRKMKYLEKKLKSKYGQAPKGMMPTEDSYADSNNEDDSYAAAEEELGMDPSERGKGKMMTFDELYDEITANQNREKTPEEEEAALARKLKAMEEKLIKKYSNVKPPRNPFKDQQDGYDEDGEGSEEERGGKYYKDIFEVYDEIYAEKSAKEKKWRTNQRQDDDDYND